MTPTLERYARIDAVPWIGEDGRARLRNATAAVLGAGNIGGQLAHHLVLLGIRVVLVDRDVVETVNLGTQSFTEDQLGLPKAEARARWLGPLNPSCRIEPVHADIRQLGLGALRECSVFFSCLDSRPARVIVNEMATRLGIPWVDGALDGSGRTMFARVAAYDPRWPEAACYLCPHDAASLRQMVEESSATNGCQSLWWDQAKELSPPTLAISALGAMVASIQAVWGLKILLGRGEEVAGKEVYFNPDHDAMSTQRLRRNPRCLFDHRRYELTPLALDAEEATLERTFDEAERRLGGPVTLLLPRRMIIKRICCPDCGAERLPFRVPEALTAAELTCNCGGAMRPSPADLLDRFGRAEVSDFLKRTWAGAGLPAAEVVVATSGESELHLLLGK